MNIKKLSVLLFALAMLTGSLQFLTRGETNTSLDQQQSNKHAAFNPQAFNDLSGFTENKGQILDQYGKPNVLVKYMYVTPEMKVQLRENGFSYEFFQQETSGEETGIAYHRIDIDFVDAQQAQFLTAAATGALKHYNQNRGPDQAITHVKTYRKVVYEELYPNIDLSFEIDSTGKMEYNFIVHEGGDASQIKLAYRGQDDLNIVDNKIQLDTRFGLVEELIPLSWYETDDHYQEVEVKYLALEDNIISFQAPKGVGDLVIDPYPVIEFSLNLFADDAGDLVILDEFSVFVTGVESSFRGAATRGAHKEFLGNGIRCFTCENGTDAYLIHRDLEGAGVYWATYYGGGGLLPNGEDIDFSYYDDEGITIDVDNQGNVYFGGLTHSKDSIATSNGYDNSYSGNRDGFLVKFDYFGVRQWGTYIGDSSEREIVRDLVVDNNGNIYVVVNSKLMKFNTAGSKLWEYDYVGTTINTVDIRQNNVYIAGRTNATSGIASSSAHQSNKGGGQDGFIANFSTSGVFKWGTYYGGNGDDEFTDIKVANQGEIIVVGTTESSTRIATGGTSVTSLQGESDAMIVRMSSFGIRIWGTYFGGPLEEWVGSLAVRDNSSIFIGGTTKSATGINTNPCSPQTTISGVNEGFLASFNVSNGTQRWGSYLPGGLSNLPEILYSHVEGIQYFNDRLYVAYNQLFSNSKLLVIRENAYNPGIGVLGNGRFIVDNASSTSQANHTDFGNHTSECLAYRTFTIRNEGQGCLFLTGESSLVQLSNDTHFTITRQPDLSVLQEAEETTFEVLYDPTAPGTHIAEIIIPNTDSDAGESNFNFRIKGSSANWNLQVSGNGTVISNGDNTPSTADNTFFGTSTGCGGTISKTFTIKNTGSSCLILENILVDGAFEITNSPDLEVGPGQTTTFTVSTLPNPGLQTGTVTILSRDLDEPTFTFGISAQLSGGLEVSYNNILVPNYDDTPTVEEGTDWGLFTFGDVVTRTYTFTNTSPCPITISSSFGPSRFRWVNEASNNTFTLTLAAGESRDLVARLYYEGFGTGVYQEELTFTQSYGTDNTFTFEARAIIQTEGADPIINNCPVDTTLRALGPTAISWDPPTAQEGSDGNIQTGDIAFTNLSITPDGGGNFSIVFLKDVPAGSEFYIFNSRYIPGSGFDFDFNDYYIIWTLFTAIPKGTVIDFEEGLGFFGAPTFEPSIGFVEDGILLNPQDRLFISTKWVPQLTDNDPALIAAIDWSGGWDPNATLGGTTSALPPMLENNQGALSFNTSFAQYDCSNLNDTGTNLSDALLDPANWNTQTPPTAAFPCSFNVTEDNFIPIELSSNYQPGDIFPTGTTTVEYTGTNLLGIPVTCSFDITINEISVEVLGEGIVINNGSTTSDLANGTNIGEVQACGPVVQQAFTIANNSAIPLNLTSTSPDLIEILGPNASYYSIVTPPAALINSNATSEFVLAFTPSEEVSGELPITINIPTSIAEFNPYTFQVTAFLEPDNVPPVAVCKDITVEVPDAGNTIITPAQIDGGSTDNCSIFGRALDFYYVICNTNNPINLTITDLAGNSSTCTANVFGADTSTPELTCNDITVYLDATGAYALTPSDYQTLFIAADACLPPLVNFTNTPQLTYDCNDLDNSFPFIFQASDFAGNNSSTCTSNVIVADTLGACIPPTDITISVSLQGRSDHSGDYTVKLYDETGNNMIQEYTVVCDATGLISLTDMSPGNFRIAVKHPQYLQKVVAVTLVAGNNPIDIGQLLAGDCNDDNFITALDFSILATSFNKGIGDTGYDDRADLNADDFITALDFSLLATNYNSAGTSPSASLDDLEDRASIPSIIDEVDLQFITPDVPVQLGEEFQVQLVANSRAQAIDAMVSLFTFDTDRLELVDLQMGNALGLELQKKVSDKGQVTVAAGTFDNFPSGEIKVATFTFRAIATGKASLTHAWDQRYTPEATFGGQSILGETHNAEILVKGPKFDVTIYPVPTNGYLTVELENPITGQNAQVRILNINGQLVYRNQLEMTTKRLDLTKLSSGVYHLQVQHGEEMIQKQVVITR